jgi:FkbM family methyltransferase
MEEELIKLKSGRLRIYVRKSEAFIYYATFVAGENNKIHLNVDDIVIDAGANIGDFTVKSANVVKKGKVIAIEPNPNNIEILKKNLILNELHNVEILQFALSNVSGSTNLNGTSVSASIMKEDENSLYVETITIEDVIMKYCIPGKEIVIKMDIEGAEELVFRNKNFLKNVREINIELHGEKNIREIQTILTENNYKIEEFGLTEQIKNTIFYMISHPISFISSERKTKMIAIKGLISTIAGKNPVPGIQDSQLRVIYGRKN